MKNVLVVLTAMTVLAAAESVESVLKKTPRPELPVVAVKLIREAKPADRKSIQKSVLAYVAEHRPTVLPYVRATLKLDEPTNIPAENRPPTTPGNEHGKRPVVPPGLNNYATP